MRSRTYRKRTGHLGRVRLARRRAGAFIAMMATMSIVIVPPMVRARTTFVDAAMLLAMMLPAGVRPIISQLCTPITRPRRWSGVDVCSRVLAVTKKRIMLNPTPMMSHRPMAMLPQLASIREQNPQQKAAPRRRWPLFWMLPENVARRRAAASAPTPRIDMSVP